MGSALYKHNLKKKNLNKKLNTRLFLTYQVLFQVSGPSSERQRSFSDLKEKS